MYAFRIAIKGCTSGGCGGRARVTKGQFILARNTEHAVRSISSHTELFIVQQARIRHTARTELPMGQLKTEEICATLGFQPVAACKYELALLARRLAASEFIETGTVLLV